MGRDLKLKLEAAPEDITVPVDTSAMMAEAEKTKSELQSMKEKCKKLIVKVKQQDALLKKKTKENSSCEESSASPTPNNETDIKLDVLVQENQVLKKEIDEMKVANEEFKEQLHQEKSS